MSLYSQEQIKKLIKLYFIMGSNNCESDPEYVLSEALKGGVTIFQFREKGEWCLTGSERIAFAKKLKQMCKAYQVPFIVNDDIELALEIDADGIHIGQEDESAYKVREKIKNKILGVSTHTLLEVQLAIHAGADYVGIGPIYPTATKKDAKSVQGTKLIQEVRAKGLNIPIVGIGGIKKENAKPIMQAGGDGVAVISEISLAANPFSSAEALSYEVMK